MKRVKSMKRKVTIRHAHSVHGSLAEIAGIACIAMAYLDGNSDATEIDKAK